MRKPVSKDRREGGGHAGSSSHLRCISAASPQVPATPKSKVAAAAHLHDRARDDVARGEGGPLAARHVWAKLTPFKVEALLRRRRVELLVQEQPARSGGV
jgi:hypothetical protein